MTRPALSALSVQQLARDREGAAAKLEAVIDTALRPALREYERLTTALGDRLHADLTQRVSPLIGLHLAQAGFGAFLERKGLTSAPASLAVIVAEQHDRAGIGE